MKLNKTVLYVNGVVLIVFVVFSIISGGGSIGIGIAFSLLAVLNVPLMFVFILTKNGQAVKTCLMMLGVFLLIGFSICSGSNWNMH